jgi:peptidyl-prolyl cis-trans isomerase SurA
MKRPIVVCVAVLAMLVPARGQQLVPSHPTNVVQRPVKAHVPGRPVALVNGAVLTDRDLLREMYQIFPYARQHHGKFPNGMEGEIRKGALQMIIFEELVYQDALHRKITVSPLKLQQAEADFRKQFATPGEYQEFMKAEFNGSQELLREKIRRSLLIDGLLQTEIARKSKVSTAEAKAYYDKNPARFAYPESFAFQTISILPPKNATPDQLKEGRKRADTALQQAKVTKSYEEFGVLAEKVSDDDYRVMMGDHRFVDRAKLAPAVVKALLSMQPGQVSDMIQVEQAYTIIRLNKHVLAGKMSFAEIKDKLKKKLEVQKTETLRAALGQALRRKAKVEVL